MCVSTFDVPVIKFIKKKFQRPVFVFGMKQHTLTITNISQQTKITTTQKHSNKKKHKPVESKTSKNLRRAL